MAEDHKACDISALDIFLHEHLRALHENVTTDLGRLAKLNDLATQMEATIHKLQTTLLASEQMDQESFVLKLMLCCLSFSVSSVFEC